MQTPIRGNEYRVTTVCIDSFDDSVLQGSFYNQYLEGCVEFKSLVEFLLKMEDVLDDMKFPQSFTAYRSFSDGFAGFSTEKTGMELRRGKLATFELKILFRQNASWQGSVTWVEGRMEQSFRSALELIFLMNGALKSSAVKTE